jgi:hypothetical protein
MDCGQIPPDVGLAARFSGRPTRQKIDAIGVMERAKFEVSGRFVAMQTVVQGGD